MNINNLYKTITPTRPGAETRLPLFVHRAGLLFWLLLPLTSHGSEAQLRELLQHLEQDARTRLTSTLQQRGWQAQQLAVIASLPEGALHLPDCQQPPRLQRTNAQSEPWGKQYYQVFCDAPSVWQTRAEVKVELLLEVWTARQPLGKQHTLTSDDVQPTVLDVTRMHRSFTPSSTSLLGFRTLRRMRPGQVLSADRLAAPLAVHKGEQVQIYARKQGFSASMPGEALEDGALGEEIRVRNTRSAKVLNAVVSATAEVETRF